VDDRVRLGDIPDGSIDSTIQVWWSANDFMVGGTRGRWGPQQLRTHNDAHPDHQLQIHRGMVNGWSPDFSHRIACLSTILRKFRAPIVVGPGLASDWGFKQDSAFDVLARQATAAFEMHGIPIISPKHYGVMIGLALTMFTF
jgi:hypothetical protein